MPEFSICHYPYTSIQINEQGDVHCCCHPWCSSYSLGNILNEPFDEIWNGQRAQEFRKQFIDDNYKYCKLDTCINAPDRKFKATLKAEHYPEVVALSYDRTCNVECIFCRDCNIKHDLSEFDEKIDVWLPEVFKNAQRVSLSGVGEALASSHTRNLIKKIVKLYPKVKFDILTNGILMDKKNINELEILNNLGVIRFSFHTFNKKTYDKLVKRGNFNKVMNNIRYISDLKAKGIVEQLEFRFVINSYNYSEMVDFAKKAKVLGANVTFLNLLKNPDTEYLFDKLNVIDKNHKDHNKFVKLLKDPIFKEDFIIINKELFNLEPVNKSLFPLWPWK